MQRIEVQPHIARLDSYAPPWTGLDRRDYLRLDLNECTSPLPQVAVEAITQQLRYFPLYPDYHTFTKKLSAYCGLPAEYLLVTNGSDQGIEVILRAFLAAGESMTIARPEFPMFGQIMGVLNARINGVAYEANLDFPYEAFRAAITPNTKLIVIINPNNPTGTPVALEYIEGLLQEFPTTPLLVDEAYFEFTGATVIDAIARYPNLIVLRTFSKAFAMAGLRLGYVAAAPDLIGEFQKIRGPFDVNSAALAAAGAQIDDRSEQKVRTAEVMQRSKPLVESFFRTQEVRFHAGAANFLLVASPRRDEIVDYLKSNRILVRPMYAEALQNMFRMSLGTVNEIRQFIEVYTRYLERS